MFAEADNFINKGATADAIDAVNQVRRRGYGKYLNGHNAVSENIKSITLSNGGANYTAAPTVTITGGGGTGATATAVWSSSTKKVTGITITNPGQAFTSTPTISFSGGGGSGAAATAVLTTLTDADLKPEQIATQQIFLETIQDERSRELCFEALRKGDLVRWGILVKNMRIVLDHIIDAKLSSSLDYIQWSYRNVSDRDVVWPIPAYDMGLNSALTQNLGW